MTAPNLRRRWRQPDAAGADAAVREHDGSRHGNHLAHGHPGRAAISLAARVLTGVLVWPTINDHILVCDAPTCNNAGPSLAIVALVMTGVLVADDSLLARETVARPPPRTSLLSPGVAAGPGSAFLSLSGRF